MSVLPPKADIGTDLYQLRRSNRLAAKPAIQGSFRRTPSGKLVNGLKTMPHLNLILIKKPRSRNNLV